MALWLMLLGCGSTVEVTPSQSACTDVNYQDPAPSELGWEAAADGTRVWRTNVFLDQAGLSFDPELAIDHGTLSIFERWTEPETDDPFCYQPEVLLTDYVGRLEVSWFAEGDDAVPFATVVVD